MSTPSRTLRHTRAARLAAPAAAGAVLLSGLSVLPGQAADKYTPQPTLPASSLLDRLCVVVDDKDPFVYLNPDGTTWNPNRTVNAITDLGFPLIRTGRVSVGSPSQRKLMTALGAPEVTDTLGGKPLKVIAGFDDFGPSTPNDRAKEAAQKWTVEVAQVEGWNEPQRFVPAPGTDTAPGIWAGNLNVTNDAGAVVDGKDVGTWGGTPLQYTGNRARLSPSNAVRMAPDIKAAATYYRDLRFPPGTERPPAPPFVGYPMATKSTTGWYRDLERATSVVGTTTLKGTATVVDGADVHFYPGGLDPLKTIEQPPGYTGTWARTMAELNSLYAGKAVTISEFGYHTFFDYELGDAVTHRPTPERVAAYYGVRAPFSFLQATTSFSPTTGLPSVIGLGALCYYELFDEPDKDVNPSNRYEKGFGLYRAGAGNAVTAKPMGASLKALAGELRSAGAAGTPKPVRASVVLSQGSDVKYQFLQGAGTTYKLALWRDNKLYTPPAPTPKATATDLKALVEAGKVLPSEAAQDVTISFPVASTVRGDRLGSPGGAGSVTSRPLAAHALLTIPVSGDVTVLTITL